MDSDVYGDSFLLLSFCLLCRSAVLSMLWYKLIGRRSGSGASVVWGCVLKYTRWNMFNTSLNNSLQDTTANNKKH
jgi:hypothetical protein